MIKILLHLFHRDLKKLITEISSYKDDQNLWKISGDTRQSGGQVKNSAGNLSLHLCGNLQHFIGAVLGKSGYVRNRDVEFSRKNVPLKELVDEIELTANVVEKTLKELKEEELTKTFPINVFGYEMTTEYFLIHLTTHLNYHLGQINYYRRLLDS